jgi:ATP adenylyltransferase
VRNEQLWAPWRLGYIQGEHKAADAPRENLRFLPGADPECFICRGLAAANDRENLIVHRGSKAAVLLNRYPYNNGHLLVAPLLHKGRLDELDADEQLEVHQVIARFMHLIERLMNAEGFNIGVNLGRAAGAGLPGHLHWHVVPRWTGDTNFMAVIGGVDVIPQALDALWEILHAQQATSGLAGNL